MYFLEFFKFTGILTITQSHTVQIPAIMSWFKHVTMSQFCHTSILFNSKTDDSNLQLMFTEQHYIRSSFNNINKTNFLLLFQQQVLRRAKSTLWASCVRVFNVQPKVNINHTIHDYMYTSKGRPLLLNMFTCNTNNNYQCFLYI